MQKQQLKISVFTISDDKITEAILQAHRRKVTISIITDNDKTLDIGLFSKNGIQVKMDMTSNHMHHKFMIADGRTVITGSYNWTNSAARDTIRRILSSRRRRTLLNLLLANTIGCGKS